MAGSRWTEVRTAGSLGWLNVARVAIYRLALRAGLHPVQRLRPIGAPHGVFFLSTRVRRSLRAPEHCDRLFGWHEIPENSPPDWHLDPFSGVRANSSTLSWWHIPDFDASQGDIKAVWETSRLAWVLHFAQRAVVGDSEAIDRLNAWLNDWSAKNPPYIGHNWKCGQEAAIRVLHLAAAALVLRQLEQPPAALTQLLSLHLERIARTTAYAVGQDNNHGTSEAAALLVGGSWLERSGFPNGAGWHSIGRRMLAERVSRLVDRDGSFSQYSVNYHRLLLDTLSLVEVWRRRLALEPLPAVVYARAAAATGWLRTLTVDATGDAPNIGANDGANLLPLTEADYRDHRPSVQLAATLFLDRSAYQNVECCVSQLQWLDVEPAMDALEPPVSRLFDGGGFGVLRKGEAVAVLRYPRFRFRPNHADGLHVDLSIAGVNVLRDGGSFSYATDPELLAYFTGVVGHNTVQFDDREQMPRIGRFLFGDWIATRALDPLHDEDDVAKVGASYVDRAGSTHHRHVTLSHTSLAIEDFIDGFERRAVLRWRLRPGRWQVHGNEIDDGVHRLIVSATMPIVRCEIVEGWESRYYLKRELVPVVEIEVHEQGRILTEYRWAS